MTRLRRLARKRQLGEDQMSVRTELNTAQPMRKCELMSGALTSLCRGAHTLEAARTPYQHQHQQVVSRWVSRWPRARSRGQWWKRSPSSPTVVAASPAWPLPTHHPFSTFLKTIWPTAGKNGRLQLPQHLEKLHGGRTTIPTPAPGKNVEGQERQHCVQYLLYGACGARECWYLHHNSARAFATNTTCQLNNPPAASDNAGKQDLNFDDLHDNSPLTPYAASEHFPLCHVGPTYRLLREDSSYQHK